MKAFRYSLQRLLDTREIIEKGRQRRVADAIRDVEREEAVVAGLRADIRRAGAWPPPGERACGVQDFTLRSQYLGYLRGETEKAERRVGECRRALAMRQEELRQAARERSSLERLREREHDAWRLEVKRVEQRDMDETASHQDLYERRDAARERARAA